MGRRSAFPGIDARASKEIFRRVTDKADVMVTPALQPRRSRIMNFPAEEDFHRLLDALTLCVLLHDAQTKAIVWANRAENP